MDEKILAEIVKLIEEGRMPKWWTDYAAQIAYNLQVHTKGLMFDKITGLFPNEHPDSQAHCVNSYQSITKGSIWKALNNIVRIFNNSSYNIVVSDKVREVIEEYQTSEGSLFSQFLEDWIKYAIAEDPNGICVVYPTSYTDDLYRYVCFNDLVSITDDYLVFVSEEESEVERSFNDTYCINETFIDYEYAKEGVPNMRRKLMRNYNPQIEKKYLNKVYHVFTKTHFIKFYKDDPGDEKYIYDFYKHPKEFESLPYFENGGVEVEKNIYESFVQAFVPFGNLALMAHRNQRAIELMHAYPKMSEVMYDCDVCMGTGFMDPAHTEVCKTCKGSKHLTIMSPYKTYPKIPQSFDADGKILSTPSVEYYTPPMGPMTFTNDLWQQYLSQAETAVFVQQKIETGNTESAKSKEIDREELYAWLANISKVLFNNLQMFLQYLENYINASPVTVSIERPYSFAILNESEAFDALSLILASDSPVPIKANQIDNFINKFVSESSPVKRAFSILKKYDLLLYYSDDAVQAMKGQGAVSGKMVQQHTLAYPVLIQMYEQDKTLFDLEDDAIIKRLSAEVDRYDLTKDLRTNLLTVPANGTPIAASA